MHLEQMQLGRRERAVRNRYARTYFGQTLFRAVFSASGLQLPDAGWGAACF
ncbi:hypothetical protein HMPREF0322_05408 [Desulfitobacterium hafniense DP7]|uniref:Uncharacterized protein n=1 Tax=Desulfitobacterium hafniense DP7 TaxID=537010 RepID=G9XWP1_DESHA|nr:hypothetical protein HMPREF0322_05408 [Desulfitobacterium hafniense DP7]